MNHSIKRYLLTTIGLSVLVTYILLSIASYVVSKDELDELYDASLQQVASTVAAQHLAIDDVTHLYNNRKMVSNARIQREEEFYVRVLAGNGEVIYVSHPQEKVPSTFTLGFSVHQQSDISWRIFATKINQETIQVAQNLKLREMTIQETTLNLILSQVLFIPVLGHLIFLAIKKSLSPLSKLSSDIQERSSLNLAPFQQNKLPSELQPLVHALNTFMGRVSDGVSILKRFTSDAAHELRTPITALKIQLSVLEQASSKDERESAIHTLKGGIERSEQLISQLLTLARTEPNNTTREVQPIKLLSLIKESIENLLPLAHEKSIDLGLSMADDIDVSGVRDDLKVLVNNIINNAIRYTPNGGKIDIALFLKSGHVVFEVNDSGPGIANSDLQRVFERFYRGDNKSVTGAGLGLSIVREIANQHSAKIEILNQNPGLSFKVYFKY